MVLGLALLGVQAALAVVVLREVRATRSAGGIAVLGELLWVIAGVGWAWYGVWTESVVLTLSGSLAAVCSTAVCVYVRRDVTRGEWQRYALFGAVSALVMVAAGAVFGVVGLSVFLAVFGLIQFLPQLRLSTTQLLRGDVVPGAPVQGPAFRSAYTGTWLIYAVAWGLAGTATIDWPIAVWGASGCVAFALQALVGLRSKSAAQEQRG